MSAIERDAQRIEERSGLVPWRVVGGVLDDVQRPAVTLARRFSDPQLQRPVVPAPAEEPELLARDIADFFGEI